MDKAKIVASALAVVLVLSIFMVPLSASAQPVKPALKFSTSEYKAQLLSDAELMALAGSDPIPYNVDMVDAETTSNDGEGIYVAVLDTGLLSNYLQFFPESMIDIKEEWGKGFTHDIYYVGSGGNFDEDGLFSYGPLRDDRGFITHDDGAPDMWGLGWGSGHGTHVTSIITGYHFTRGTVDTWVSGVAPGVTIIPVLVLDDWVGFDNDGNGYFFTGGTDEMVAAGIRYVGDLAKEHQIKIVINLSLGGSTPAPMIEEAINYAISQGCIIVASAGNEGEDGMGWPGAYNQVISAAAAGWTQEYGGGNSTYYWWWNDVPEKLNTVNTVLDPTTGITYKNNGQTYLADFSSRANKALGQTWKQLDVAAPGCAIRGPYKPYGSGQWAFYGVWGTSQAAPHVSGMAALLLQSYPTLTQAGVEKIFKKAATGVPMPSDGAFISDVFSGYAIWKYYWNDHDAGSGFLTFDEVMKVAKTYK
jgi:subtilisin family serine protease